jgi:hypothetical protein
MALPQRQRKIHRRRRPATGNHRRPLVPRPAEEDFDRGVVQKARGANGHKATARSNANDARLVFLRDRQSSAGGAVALVSGHRQGDRIPRLQILGGHQLARPLQVRVVQIKTVIGHRNHHRSRASGQIPSPLHGNVRIRHHIPGSLGGQVPLLAIETIGGGDRWRRWRWPHWVPPPAPPGGP